MRQRVIAHWKRTWTHLTGAILVMLSLILAQAWPGPAVSRADDAAQSPANAADEQLQKILAENFPNLLTLHGMDPTFIEQYQGLVNAAAVCIASGGGSPQQCAAAVVPEKWGEPVGKLPDPAGAVGDHVAEPPPTEPPPDTPPGPEPTPPTFVVTNQPTGADAPPPPPSSAEDELAKAALGALEPDASDATCLGVLSLLLRDPARAIAECADRSNKVDARNEAHATTANADMNADPQVAEEDCAIFRYPTVDAQRPTRGAPMLSALLIPTCEETAPAEPPAVSSGTLTADEIKAKQEQMRREFEAAGTGDKVQAEQAARLAQQQAEAEARANASANARSAAAAINQSTQEANARRCAQIKREAEALVAQYRNLDFLNNPTYIRLTNEYASLGCPT